MLKASRRVVCGFRRRRAAHDSGCLATTSARDSPGATRCRASRTQGYMCFRSSSTRTPPTCERRPTRSKRGRRRTATPPRGLVQQRAREVRPRVHQPADLGVADRRVAFEAARPLRALAFSKSFRPRRSRGSPHQGAAVPRGRGRGGISSAPTPSRARWARATRTCGRRPDLSAVRSPLLLILAALDYWCRPLQGRRRPGPTARPPVPADANQSRSYEHRCC